MQNNHDPGKNYPATADSTIQCLNELDANKISKGHRLAEWTVQLVGSWKFIIIQSVLLVLWTIVNIVAWFEHWDPYPFILLNLFLALQAAYTGPSIMMSQNRQAEIDRQQASSDFEVNVKAELEIELLHQKIDLLKEKELLFLTEAIRDLSNKIEHMQTKS